TGMVDVAGLILQRLAVDVVPVIERKHIGVALGESLHTFFFGNLGANVLNDPSTLLNILGCEKSLSGNPRRTHTYLNLHRVTFSFWVTPCSPLGVARCQPCLLLPLMRMQDPLSRSGDAAPEAPCVCLVLPPTTSSVAWPSL